MLIPDYETEVDFLNCEAISQTVVEVLRGYRRRALTIGIHGDWGAGKSSILKMIERDLAPNKNVACLWFNGWAFEGFDDAKTVLIEATITELCRQRSTVGKVKELGTRLLKRVDWLKVAKRGSGLATNLLTGLPAPDQIQTAISSLRSLGSQPGGVKAEDLETGIEDVISHLKPTEDGDSIPDTIHAFREEFEALLEEAKIDQLVVLIDDLDRCLPGTAIETLEAIRLFLFVPKTAFVIGADEAMIEYAVRQHFPELPVSSGSLPYARNYLEKLVQIPFRIPALGAQETRVYVTLLLVQSLVDETHKGFQTLLKKAKAGLSKPWLGKALSQTDVQAVDPARRDALNASFVLAHQIAPMLAEGTKGNPRQVKRFLNALLVRQSIAKARGFADEIKQPVLAKLMLAERFQPDFYDHLAAKAMAAPDGKVSDLATLETTNNAPAKAEKGKATSEEPAQLSAELSKWLEREWLVRWLSIEPSLANEDLRPYVFVARDKRLLSAAGATGGLERLMEHLSSNSSMALSVAASKVRDLSDAEADAAFSALRERVLATGDFTQQPNGIKGLGIIAKHHVRFQREVVSLLASLDASKLGFWVTAGWNEYITDSQTRIELRALMEGWAQQEDNQVLKRAASGALPALKKGVD